MVQLQGKMAEGIENTDLEHEKLVKRHGNVIKGLGNVVQRHRITVKGLGNIVSHWLLKLKLFDLNTNKKSNLNK